MSLKNTINGIAEVVKTYGPIIASAAGKAGVKYGPVIAAAALLAVVIASGNAGQLLPAITVLITALGAANANGQAAKATQAAADAHAALSRLRFRR